MHCHVSTELHFMFADTCNGMGELCCKNCIWGTLDENVSWCVGPRDVSFSLLYSLEKPHPQVQMSGDWSSWVWLLRLSPCVLVKSIILHFQGSILVGGSEGVSLPDLVLSQSPPPTSPSYHLCVCTNSGTLFLVPSSPLRCGLTQQQDHSFCHS